MAIKKGEAVPSDFDGSLATLSCTLRTTAILEAGRRSLDAKKTVRILYEDPQNRFSPTSLQIDL